MRHLLLLHGAVGAWDQLELLVNSLTEECAIHLANFSGHGRKPIPDNRFSIELFAKDVI
jgi:hypothetical protein